MSDTLAVDIVIDGETEPRSTSAYTRLMALARGGMGEVEIALRKEGAFKRLYAVKRLHPHLRNDERVREMFLAEARIAGLIRHSNVVSVLDVGEDDRGPYLVMDYIDGIPATTAIRKHLQIGELPPLQLVLRIIAETARGLHAAHELRDHDGTPRPTVHRDVSPQNILLGFDGVTRVTDFGVAKALGHLAQTDDGVLKGKLGYMSPEQLRFMPVDGRSDLFSLAVVLFELLTCRRLYWSPSNTPTPRRILEEPPPDLGEERSDLPPELVALSFRLFAKDPDHRPSSAKEVADQLDLIRASMEAEQGVISLADHLSACFAREREQQHHAIAEAIRSIDQPVVPSGTRGVTSAEPETVDIGLRAKVERNGPGRRRRAALLAFSVVAGIGGALAVGLWLGLGWADRPGATDGSDTQVEENAELPNTETAGARSDPAVVPIPIGTSIAPEEADADERPASSRRERPRSRRTLPRAARGAQATQSSGEGYPPRPKTTNGPRYQPWSYEEQ